MRSWIVILALAVASGSADAFDRVPNGTLRLPPAPPIRGFAVEPAFPELSFSSPICLAAPPNETNRLFVVERAGRIIVLTNLASPTRTTFLDIAARVNTAGEGGLLGLAFHPGYATNGWFYVYYTLTTNTDAGSGFHDRLARFQVSPTNPDSALPESEVVLITQFDQASNHNGGDVHFGPDGHLYVSLGDEGGARDQYQNGQRIDRDFFAAILRLDVDHRPGSLPPNPHPAVGAGYSIPADNPFLGATQFNGQPTDPARVRTEFWAIGLRNPWRFSFDALSGWLYCGDVGQELWEEIDIVRGGGNYGWHYREGFHAFTGTPPAGATFADPIWEYPHSGPAIGSGYSITGGVVYRGTRLAQLYGHYVWADYGSGNVWAFLYNGATVTDFRRLTYAGNIVAFGTDPANGDVLLASINGPIYRLVYSAVSAGDPLPPTLADTGAFVDLLSLEAHPGIVPYTVNVPFWSDHALKTRWFSVPDTNQFLGFDATGTWTFPTGTVWVKHFELELSPGAPKSRRRLETRFLVRNNDGTYGITYRWDDSQANAQLVPEEGTNDTFLITDGLTTRTQVWHYPARSECAICHTPVAGLALGFGTAQLNRDVDRGGTPTNQVLALAALGYFTNPPARSTGWPALANATNETATLEERSRSFLAANCVQCHQPGGLARGQWDARYSVPLAAAGLVNGPLEDPGGDPANRVIAPGSIDHSMILGRLMDLGPGHMPPLATSEINTQAIALLSRWVTQDLATFTLSWTASPLTVQIGGTPGRTYRVQASPDLASWKEEAEVTADAAGLASYRVDPLIGDARFYRVAWP